MYNHQPVFRDDESLSESSFNKRCARPDIIGTSGQFATSLPAEINLNTDLSWESTRILDYTIEYGEQVRDQGFLAAKVEEEAGVPPTPEGSFSYEETVFLQQIGNLSKAQKKKIATDPDSALDLIFMQIKVSDVPEVFARIRFEKAPEPEPTATDTPTE